MTERLCKKKNHRNEINIIFFNTNMYSCSIKTKNLKKEQNYVLGRGFGKGVGF